MHGNFYRLLTSVVLLAAAVFGLSATPFEHERKHLLDSLEVRLQEINNGEDSIRTLYNIFDLCTTNKSRTAILHNLYLTAKKHGEYDDQASVLIYLARIYNGNIKALEKIEAELKTLPDSPMSRECQLYVQMLKSANLVNAESSEMQKERLSELVKKFSECPPDDKFHRAELLFTLCTIMDKSTHGELLQHYLMQLIELVDSLDLRTGYVRNLVYGRSGPILTRNRMFKEAVKVDKRLLNIIDSLEISYIANDRPFRSLNGNRYEICTRMLINYRALSLEEVVFFHDRIKEMAASDPEIAKTLKEREIPEIFYHVARKEYATALPIIKRQLNNPQHKLLRPALLRALIEASAATGDTRTQLDAAMQLNDLYEKTLDDRSNNRYRELQIIYDYNDLRNTIADRERELKDRDMITNKNLIIFVGTVCFVFIVLTLLLFRLYRKSKRLATEYFKTSVMLRSERNDLKRVQQELIESRDKACEDDRRKTEFTSMMSHEVKVPLASLQEYSRLIVDCISDEHRSYLDRFAFNIEQNVKTINRLVSDVLDLSSLEYDSLSINMSIDSIDAICRVALENVFYNGNASSKDVKVIYNSTGQPDANIITDTVRVRQVLTNLLHNADKFTESGTISLEYEIDEDASQIRFIVTDTGIGIPDNCEELIFERFRKLNPISGGLGLGLYLARTVAILLKGDVRVDTTYRKGARFIFTIMKEDWNPEGK